MKTVDLSLAIGRKFPEAIAVTVSWDATHDRPNIIKSRESGFVCLPASWVRPPLIDGACANFECRVVGTLASGDHTIFLGEVMASHLSDHNLPRLFSMNDGSFAVLSGAPPTV